MDNNASLIDWTPELYSKLSKRYDLLAPIFFSMGERAKKRVADELKSGLVLDIACGTGALLAVAFSKGLECCGTDNAEGMIAESQRKIPQGEFKLASFYDIPYPDDTFDTVLETNTIEGYNRQLRKVTKNKASFPTSQAVRKLLYLANVNIFKKWTRPLINWPLILNQLAIRFDDRFPF